MKKLMSILTLTACLLLLGGVVNAGDQPIQKLWDDFNDETGTGSAMIYLGDDKYALIEYEDVNNNGEYDEGDVITRTFYVRVMPL